MFSHFYKSCDRRKKKKRGKVLNLDIKGVQNRILVSKGMHSNNIKMQYHDEEGNLVVCFSILKSMLQTHIYQKGF